jgi:predicted dehydrogenase
MAANSKRVALIGYGMAGSIFHAPFIATTEGLELAAVVTRDPERRAALAQQHPQAVALDSADDLWKSPSDYDLVVVASPNKTHVKLAESAIRAGIPVVVDKPLAATVGQATELIELAKERNVPLTVFQNRRWDGDVLTVRRLIDEGRLGEVWRFESRYERWRPQISDGWRESDDPSEAGGVLYDLGVHMIDQALLLFGPAGKVYGERSARRDGARVDDDAFVAIQHRSGTTSHIWLSSTTAKPGPRLRVLGSKAGYVKNGMDPQEQALKEGVTPGSSDWGADDPVNYGQLGDEVISEPIPTLPGDYGEFYKRMTDVLEKGVPVPVNPADSLPVLAIIERIRRESPL